MPPYQYEALPEAVDDLFPMRLVILLPGQFHDPLKCHIRTVQIRLDGSVEYEALSYCWGEAPAVAAISVANKTVGGEVPLYQNLYDALVGLRYSTSERTLWIDSISINQSDINERGAQVRIMHKIYRAASNVIVWLQKPASKSYRWNPKRAFRIVEQYCRLSQEQPDMVPFRRSSKERWRRLRSDTSRYSTTECVRSMLSCTWFRRIWIIQEVSCSRKATLICADGSSMDFGRFVDGLKFATKKGLFQTTLHTSFYFSGYHENPASWNAAVQMDAIRNRDSLSGDGLFEYLNRFLGSQCSDPRDKIFAMYGISELPHEKKLAAAFKHEDLRPDYRRDISELYIAAARVCMSSENLDILSRPIVKSHPGLRLPSWVPDWSSGDPLTTLGSLTAPREYHASGDSIATPSFTTQRQCKLQGIIIGTIDAVGSSRQIPLSAAVPNTALRTLTSVCAQITEWVFQSAQWESHYHSCSNTYPFSYEPFSDVFYSMAQATRLSYETQWFQPGLQTPDKISDQEMREFLKQAHEIIRIMISMSPLSPRDNWKLLTAVIKTFTRHKTKGILTVGIYDDQIFRERNIFASSYGHFGVCPVNAKTGDKIALLSGSTVPLILRQRVDDEKIFSLVGDAYVHGIMQGEAFDAKACIPITIE